MATRRAPLVDIGNTLNNGPAFGKEKTNVIVDKSQQAGATKSRLSACNVQPSISSLGLTSPRVDEKYKSNHLYTDYMKEIMEHFRRAEAQNRPSVTYMGRQSDINEKMRSILIDWLVDVHLKFKLQPETLYLTIDIIDRYLDSKTVTRQKLQLVGVVSMLLASKYEEIYPPEVKDFIYISANTYTRDEVLRMERLILATLDFNLTVPTLYVFLKRALQVADADKTTCQMAHYVAELSMLEYKMLVYLPSTIAAACIYLANKIMNNSSDPWPIALSHYTHYKIPNFERCAKDLFELMQGTPAMKYQAIKKKYSYPKYLEVSKIATEQLSTSQLIEFP